MSLSCFCSEWFEFGLLMLASNIFVAVVRKNGILSSQRTFTISRKQSFSGGGGQDRRIGPAGDQPAAVAEAFRPVF